MGKVVEGQKLWFAPADSRYQPDEITVAKVGRKWAHTSGGLRIGVETLVADGGEYSSPGRAWLSQQEYQENADLKRAWLELTSDISRVHRPPDGLTVKQIAEIRRLVWGAAKEPTP